MNLLLDTHVWLWSLTAPELIAAETLDLMSDMENQLYFSTVSAWEIAIKYRIGKLPLPEPPVQFVPSRLNRDGIVSLPVENRHALAVSELPLHHNDPFDHLLIAQAQVEGYFLVTYDEKIMAYDVEIIHA